MRPNEAVRDQAPQPRALLRQRLELVEVHVADHAAEPKERWRLSTEGVPRRTRGVGQLGAPDDEVPERIDLPEGGLGIGRRERRPLEGEKLGQLDGVAGYEAGPRVDHSMAVEHRP